LRSGEISLLLDAGSASSLAHLLEELLLTLQERARVGGIPVRWWIHAGAVHSSESELLLLLLLPLRDLALELGELLLQQHLRCYL